MRVRLVAAAAATLVLATGCRDTEWPSGADRDRFCATVTGAAFAEGDYDELARLGTPENLPFAARRYLLDLAEDDEPDPEQQAVFEKYVADYC